MYLLLIGVHILFFFIAYLLGNILLQGAFVLLLIFFLLYFSPVFFSDSPRKSDTGIQVDISLSPKRSILIPLVLAYVGIYVLAFTVTRDLGTNFNLHLYILLLIFLIFGGYIFAFDWDTVFFRDALRFHLICSYVTIFAQLVYFFVFSGDITSIHLLFAFVTLGFSYFFFTYFRDENVNIFLACVLSLIISIDTIILYLLGDIHIFTLLGLTGLIIIPMFEYIPKVSVFYQFTESSRILLLTVLLGIAGLLTISPLFSFFHFTYFLPVFTVFFFSLHIRYSNYITYSLAIFLLFFLYSYFFSSLLFTPDLFLNLLFIFFFSICIIGNTYFWKEQYLYDFSLLHYSSIGFSTITGLYSLFFVAWGTGLTLFLACYLFLMASLFLLSYFRFQYQ